MDLYYIRYLGFILGISLAFSDFIKIWKKKKRSKIYVKMCAFLDTSA